MIAGAWQDYVYPGTNVLRNKVDLRNPEDLQRFERGVTALRIQELREHPLRGDFDLAHLRAIHKHVFQDIYDWAGELRTIDMAKGGNQGRTILAYTEQIADRASHAHALVKEARYGREMAKGEFAKTMADIYAVVNVTHPFRDGNGRATREYLGELASQSGRRLNYEMVSSATWNEAAMHSTYGNTGPLRDVFYEITTVERAVAFDKLQSSEALAKYPELDGAYKMLEQARNGGQDLDRLSDQLSRQLHAGKVIAGEVTLQESKMVLSRAAAYRGLMVRDVADTGGNFKGEVVAISSHHALLKVGDMVAIRYERGNLDRQLYQHERVSIQYGSPKSQVLEQSKEPPKERGFEMQIERQTTLR